jgi:hypothetical protein
MPNAPKRPFHTAAAADIKSGEVSDVYFARDFVLDQLRSVPLDTLRRQGLRDV